MNKELFETVVIIAFLCFLSFMIGNSIGEKECVAAGVAEYKLVNKETGKIEFSFIKENKE